MMFSDNMLTPFVYSYYTKNDKYCPVVIADYPMLQYYLHIIHNNNLDKMREAFKVYLNELKDNNFYYNYEIVEKHCNFLNTRLGYSVEVIRQMCYSAKRICVVINYQHIEKIGTYWKKIGKEIKPLNSFYNDVEKNKDVYFVDFIEKMVILDILNGGFVNDNFVEHKVVVLYLDLSF
jgi:hypothetical protein